jgi:hypothetical protein
MREISAKRLQKLPSQELHWYEDHSDAVRAKNHHYEEVRKRIFDACDANKDHVISKEEF